MKLALEIDGTQVSHVVIKSLEKSIEFCNTYEDDKHAAELLGALKRVLKLYKNEPAPRWLARTIPDEDYPAFIRGSN
ncbi:MAG TPA: hypothetical protein EYF95_10155 [Flavobacteriales bacterium]|jgi:hypothetical protein|nr:hypothetical protein [Flavobacteriales bacterium]HIK68315.1 hypothetical protein [Flavobacteriales bacterium]